MTLEDGAALIAQLERGPWRDADPNVRFEILALVDERIIALRERTGLVSFDDPLPGEPASVFLLIREALQ
jgi:hypothetical protein